MNRVLLAAAQLLPGEDREVVLGDICESELTTTQAFFDLCGLVARRTLRPYADWSVWVCLGLAPLLSLLLIGISVALAAQVCHLKDDGGISIHSWFQVFRLSTLLFAASTTSSMAAVSLARNATLPLLLAALMPAVICFHSYHSAGASSFSVFLFVLPTAAGVWLASRRKQRWCSWAITATLLLTILLGPLPNNGWVWFNGALLMVPAVYCSSSLPSKGHNA
jgi:hypothetical protein